MDRGIEKSTNVIWTDDCWSSRCITLHLIHRVLLFVSVLHLQSITSNASSCHQIDVAPTSIASLLGNMLKFNTWLVCKKHDVHFMIHVQKYYKQTNTNLRYNMKFPSDVTIVCWMWDCSLPNCCVKRIKHNNINSIMSLAYRFTLHAECFLATIS